MRMQSCPLSALQTYELRNFVGCRWLVACNRRSEKSQSARLFSRQDLADSIARAGRAGGAGTGGGLGGLSPSWGDSSSTGAGGGAAGAPAQTWQVPFIAAGGNRFLQAAAAAASAADDGSGVAAAVPPPPGPSVAAIASGQAALLADPLLAHRLELQLAAVAPKLAAVAVLLKTQLLPAMPWLSMEASDRLQVGLGWGGWVVECGCCIAAFIALDMELQPRLG